MTEATTMREVLVPLITDVVDDDLVACQWFYPGGGWNSGYPPFRKLARLVIGRGRVDDGLSRQSVVAITATRVLFYRTGISRAAGFSLRDLAYQCPREQVTGTVRKVTLTGNGRSVRLHSKTFSRAKLDTPGGLLVADLPDKERASQRIITELGLTKIDRKKR